MNNLLLPHEHELRRVLNNELHSHPYEPLTPPERIIFLSMLVTPEDRNGEEMHIQELVSQYDVVSTEKDSSRIRYDFGRFRLKIDRHLEFTRYKLVWRPDDDISDNPLANSIEALLPEGWLAKVPGRMLNALNVALLQYPQEESNRSLIKRYEGLFEINALAASQVGRSKGLAITDFKIKQDGFIPMLVFTKAGLPGQNGRLMLRLLEVEIYRSLALLSLPDAKVILSKLPVIESKLATLTESVATSTGGLDEVLLEKLTTLAAEVERIMAANYQRLTASSAYFSLVFKRLRDLREEPVEDVTSIGGMLDRRLEPAKTTCELVAYRLDQISRRISHASQLLRTRIEVRRETQNQTLLIGMDSRFRAQLRLQETAELLSIVIVPYYGVNLLSYLVEEFDRLTRLGIDPIATKAIGVPLIAVLTLYLLKKMRGHQH